MSLLVSVTDALRPDGCVNAQGVPLGRAKGGHTAQLDEFIEQYKRQIGLGELE